jgi:integrase
MSAKPAVPGDGSIFPYKGKWAAFVWVITPTGEKARKWLYGATEEELTPAFNELKVQAAKVPVPTSTPTVTEYLTYWLAEVIKPNREDGTYSAYELSSRLHIIPGIGAKSIDPRKLTVRVTQTWLNKLAITCQCCAQKKDAKRKAPRCCAAGACCEDYPSRRVIEGARNTLRAALNNAMREELIGRNVAELVTLPKSRKKSTRRSSWDVDEARRFLESSRRDNDPLYPLWVLILVMGLRRGEAMGLVDDDGIIDEDAGAIGLEWQLGRVGGHPITHKHVLKTDGSVETLPIPPIVLSALRIARKMQAERRTPEWPEVCICGERHRLLFTTDTGRPIEPRNLKRSFDARCKRAGVRQIKIHDTRRTCGSLLAALEVHPRVAMAVLRHSKISMTMEIYSQVPDKTTREALQRLSDLLGDGHQADPSTGAVGDASRADLDEHQADDAADGPGRAA